MRTLFTGLCLLISLTLGAAACNIFPSGPPTWRGAGGGATTTAPTDVTPCGPYYLIAAKNCMPLGPYPGP